MQNFIELSSAVHDLSDAQRNIKKTPSEHNTVDRNRGQ